MAADPAHPVDEQPLPLAAGEHPPVPGAVKVASVDMANRRQSSLTKARKQALDVLFEADLMDRPLQAALNDRLDDRTRPVRDLTREIVLGVLDNAEEIDRRITAALPKDWTLQRMARVDRNLARIALYELDHTDIDERIAISEALELADGLSTDESVVFLNGLLGQAARSRKGKTNEQR